MNYFKNFPNILYLFDIGGRQELRVMKDIVLNIRFIREVVNNVSLYDTYDINDGDTPEIIAEKLYGDPGLHWILMIFNEKLDFYNDFPLSESALIAYIETKYGVGNAYGQHVIFDTLHYEDKYGNVVDGPTTETVRPVTNYEYEAKMNEAKRRIKVIHRNLIPSILDELETAFPAA